MVTFIVIAFLVWAFIYSNGIIGNLLRMFVPWVVLIIAFAFIVSYSGAWS